MSDIFMSYSRADEAKVRKLVELFRSHGWSVWRDDSIVAGETWSNSIREAIENARCVVVAWSDTSIASEFVMDEAVAGRERKILVPLRFDPVDIPFGFQRLHTVDLLDWTGDPTHPGFITLLQSLEKLLGPAKNKVVQKTGAAQETSPSEWRQISVLVAEATTDSLSSSSLDPTVVDKLQGRFVATVEQVIEQFRGTMDLPIDHGVVAIFGVPKAHSRDCESAVRAALEILDRLGNKGKTIESLPQMGCRIGIASGLALVAPVQAATKNRPSLRGQVIDQAFSLMEMANIGEILVSDEVSKAVANTVVLDDLNTPSENELLKNTSVGRVVGISQDFPTQPTSLFIGRDRELHLLQSAAEHCSVSGSGEVIMIRGEAGIGKSRLVDEFLSQARRLGFTSHIGRVLDFGASAREDPIAAVVMSFLDVTPESSPLMKETAAKELLSSPHQALDYQTHLKKLLDLPLPAQQISLFDAMDNKTRKLGRAKTALSVAQHICNAHPIAVVFEDVHWATPELLAQIAVFSKAVSELAMLLVLTARIEDLFTDESGQAFDFHVPMVTINLQPLHEQERKSMVAEYLDLNDDYAQKCIVQSSGNPLFLEQMLQNRHQADVIPGSIRSIVLSKLDNLDKEHKRAAQAASVLGTMFGLDELRYLLGNESYTPGKLLEYLLIKENVENYSFVHSIVRDAIYSSQIKSTKRQLHFRAAEWYARRDPVLFAKHLDLAESPETGAAYLTAASALVDDYRYEESLRLVERGLLCTNSPKDQFQLSLLHGQLLAALEFHAESVEAYKKAEKISPDDVGRCRARIGIARGLRALDRYQEALKILECAKEIASSNRFLKGLAKIHYMLGNIYFPLGELDLCLEHHNTARDLARTIDSKELEARSLGGLGDAYYMRGLMLTAESQFDQCIDICREHGFKRIEVGNLYMRGTTRWYQNRIETAMADCTEAAALANVVGHIRGQMLARRGVAGLHLEMGNLKASMAEHNAGLELARRIKAKRFEPWSLADLGKILAKLGRRRDAVKLVEGAYRISQETGTQFVGPRVLGALAIVSDDGPQRRRALQEGEKLLAGKCVGHNYFWFYRDAMDACLQSEEFELVDHYAAALESYTLSEPLPWSDFFIARGRALAAFGRGRRDAELKGDLLQLKSLADSAKLILALEEISTALNAMDVTEV